MVVGLSGPTMNDIGTIEYWRDHARELRGKLGKAADEIERLRGDNKALEGGRNVPRFRNCARATIRRSGMMILLIVVRCVEQSGASRSWSGGLLLRKKRTVSTTLERGISEHVPDEMKKIFERAAAAVWNALGKLGIERCEMCKGTVQHPKNYSCIHCNDEGWVMIGGGDE
jgi:hypothetical protein